MATNPVVIGISMVKDEADVIGHTCRRMLAQVDHLIVADNLSTDQTRHELDRLGVEVIDDTDRAYHQSAKMSRLAAIAAAEGADWIVPFDADEVWYSPFGRISDVLAGLDTATTAPACVYDHVATALDPDEPDPVARIGWRRREANALPKVACRPRLPVTIHQGNHAATYPTCPIDGQLIVRHFPYRSAEQMVRKARNGAAAYAATDLPEHEGKHWRDYGRLTDEQIGDTFRSWFWAPDPASDALLIFDPCPV